MDKLAIKLDIFKWDCIRITPSTLFKKSDYKNLSTIEQWQKAINDGWRYDINLNKFYKLIKK
jgi:hypothetical protein